MRVLFVITSWDVGGAEMQVLNLARSMQSLKHQILIVSMIGADNDFLEYSDTLKLKVKSLEIKKGAPDIKAIYRLYKLIKSFKPNVLHAHMIHSVVLSRITRLFIKIPKLVSTAHSINEGGKIRDLMYRYTDFLSDVNTNVSDIGTKEYIKNKLFKKSKTIFIPNGINLPDIDFSLDKISKIKKELDIDSQFVWLAIGRLVEAKDYINLVKAIYLLKKESNKEFIVLIAGSGEMKDVIDKKIYELKLHNEIKLLGRRNDITSLLQVADAFVMSSAWEGLPIALLEAQNEGLPIVASNVGGCSELIKDNITGYLVPPKNDKSLSKAMIKMMNLSYGDRKKMGEIAMLNIRDNYELSIIVNKWLEIYKT